RVIDDDLNLTVAADLLHINLSELRRAGLDHLVADQASVPDSVTLSQCCVGRNVRFEGPAKLQRCVVFDDVVIPPHTERADAIFYEDHVLAC
ncbi:MAG: hypothetical protein JXQ73_20760, partial [Phycisphaerae bacterium]|nr:hypothetical protein [Phycisphaerae bacterium]